MTFSIRIITIAVLGIAFIACSKENQQRGATQPNSARNSADMASNDNPNEDNGNRDNRGRNDGNRYGSLSPAAETRSAATSLTQSRCAREQRCSNIGAGKKYSSFADCEAEVGNDWRADLNARECKAGIDQGQLDECLTEIRNEECGNPFDSLERIAACTQSQICDND